MKFKVGDLVTSTYNFPLTKIGMIGRLDDILSSDTGESINFQIYWFDLERHYIIPKAETRLLTPEEDEYFNFPQKLEDLLK